MSSKNKRFTAEELLEKYSSAQVRSTILDLWALSRILSECVIQDDYLVSGDMNAALSAASEEGAKIRFSLMDPRSRPKGMKDQITLRPDEINLMNLLELFGVDLLLEIDKVDPKHVAELIGEEIKERKLLFPFEFGRETYDKFNQVQELEAAHIDYEKTIACLTNSPIGVFQQRRFLFGPYGMIYANHLRSVAPRRDIHLQHSADRSYKSPHRVWLSTSSVAPINRYRSLYLEQLYKSQGQASDWPGFIEAITISSKNDYDEGSLRSLPYALGDCLSTSELRALLNEVSLMPYVRELIQSTGSFSVFEDGWTDGLERNQTMQLLLCATNEDLKASLDKLIKERVIDVPLGEIRAPVLNGLRYFGQWGTYMQIGSLGSRVVGRYPRLAHLRLESLAERVYDESSPVYRKNVSWKLREFDKLEGFSRVREAMRRLGPRKAVFSLLVSQRESLELAARDLAFDLDPAAADESFADVILWKLGFDVTGIESKRISYREMFEKTLSSIPASSSISGWVHSLRQTTVNYFVKLEEYLKEILAFVTWSQMADHFKSDRPFLYIPERAVEFTAQELNIDAFEKLNLSPTLQRFKQLRKQLQSIRNERGDHLRDVSDFPDYSRLTQLQSFPFRHRVPYLDLEVGSQDEIIRWLDRFADEMSDTNIVDIRNSLLHPGRDVPEPQSVREVLDRVDIAIRNLEEVGLTPLPVQFVSAVTGLWGETEYHYRRDRSRDITLYQPSKLDFAGMPGFRFDQIVMNTALIAGAGEPLRFGLGAVSEYSRYWSNFPIIPKSSDVIAKQSVDR